MGDTSPTSAETGRGALHRPGVFQRVRIATSNVKNETSSQFQTLRTHLRSSRALIAEIEKECDAYKKAAAEFGAANRRFHQALARLARTKTIDAAIGEDAMLCLTTSQEQLGAMVESVVPTLTGQIMLPLRGRIVPEIEHARGLKRATYAAVQERNALAEKIAALGASSRLDNAMRAAQSQTVHQQAAARCATLQAECISAMQLAEDDIKATIAAALVEGAAQQAFAMQKVVRSLRDTVALGDERLRGVIDPHSWAPINSSPNAAPPPSAGGDGSDDPLATHTTPSLLTLTMRSSKPAQQSATVSALLGRFTGNVVGSSSSSSSASGPSGTVPGRELGVRGGGQGGADAAGNSVSLLAGAPPAAPDSPADWQGNSGLPARSRGSDGRPSFGGARGSSSAAPQASNLLAEGSGRPGAPLQRGASMAVDGGAADALGGTASAELGAGASAEPPGHAAPATVSVPVYIPQSAVHLLEGEAALVHAEGVRDDVTGALGTLVASNYRLRWYPALHAIVPADAASADAVAGGGVPGFSKVQEWGRAGPSLLEGDGAAAAAATAAAAAARARWSRVPSWFDLAAEPSEDGAAAAAGEGANPQWDATADAARAGGAEARRARLLAMWGKAAAAAVPAAAAAETPPQQSHSPTGSSSSSGSGGTRGSSAPASASSTGSLSPSPASRVQALAARYGGSVGLGSPVAGGGEGAGSLRELAAEPADGADAAAAASAPETPLTVIESGEDAVSTPPAPTALPLALPSLLAAGASGAPVGYRKCRHASFPLLAIAQLEVVGGPRGSMVVRTTDLRMASLSFAHASCDAAGLLAALAPLVWTTKPHAGFAAAYRLPPAEGAPGVDGWRLFTIAQEWHRMAAASPPGWQDRWRVSTVNAGYRLCGTYPQGLIMPAEASDDLATAAGKFRSKRRLPTVTWFHGSVALARASQPLSGMFGARSPEDERLVDALLADPNDPAHVFGATAGSGGGADAGDASSVDSHAVRAAAATQPTTAAGTGTMTPAPSARRRRSLAPATGPALLSAEDGGELLLAILDARPRVNAIANRTKGGGAETIAHYRGAGLAFLGIDNIHVVRDALKGLRGRLLADRAKAMQRQLMMGSVAAGGAPATGRDRGSRSARQSNAAELLSAVEQDGREGAASISRSTSLRTAGGGNVDSDDFDAELEEDSMVVESGVVAESGQAGGTAAGVAMRRAASFISLADTTGDDTSRGPDSPSASNALRRTQSFAFDSATDGSSAGLGASSSSAASAASTGLLGRSGMPRLAVVAERLLKMGLHAGSTGSDAPSSFAAAGQGGEGDASLSSLPWLRLVSILLRGAVRVAEHLACGVSVLVHCSDGWDRTAGLTSLAQLMIDPYYRTLPGFCVLVEKEWCAYGHRFAKRCGTGGCGYDRAAHEDDQRAPIFLQWVDAVWQLWRQSPSAFEFNDRLLVALAEHAYSGRFGTFLLDCDRDRTEASLAETTTSLWSYVLHPVLGKSFVNPAYSPMDVRETDADIGSSPGSRPQTEAAPFRLGLNTSVIPQCGTDSLALWPHWFLRWE